jgi:hypothetical protein
MTGPASTSRNQANPVDNDIRTRAYHIWEAEGRPGGREIDHWLKARAELENEVEANAPAKSAPAKMPRKPAGRTPAKSSKTKKR